MDVLILERDPLVAEVLADALADEGLTTAVTPTEQEAAVIDDPPRVVITSINRTGEDLKGLEVSRALCARWRCNGAIYMAALWPLRLREKVLSGQERFLPKPVQMTQFLRAVRELLGFDARHAHS